MTIRIIELKGGSTLAGYAQIGTGTNGTVTVIADAAVDIADAWTITVVAGVGNNVPLSATLATHAITVTLGTTGAGLLDATKNTAVLVAAAITALAGVTAYASGTGASALTGAQASQSFGGGKAQDHLLCTLADVKTALEITDSTHDATLSALIEAASAQIYEVTDRIWAQQTYSERCPGFGDLTLNLGRWPVQSLVSVYQDTSLVDDAIISNPEAGQLYREDGWLWTAQSYWNINPVVTTEEPLFTIVYVAGYWLPNWAGPSSPTNPLPKNIRQACVNAVSSWYKKTYTATTTAGDISEIAIPGHRIKYANVVDEGAKDSAAKDFRLPVEALALLPRQRPWG